MDDKTFDCQADAKDWMAIVESPGQPREQDIYPRLKTWVEAGKPLHILEVGCGQGACSAQLPLSDLRYTGLEPSPFLLARAQELYCSPERSFIAGNAYLIPLAEGQFEAVFSVAVWHLLGDIRKAAAEMARVLKPGGLLYFTDVFGKPVQEYWHDMKFWWPHCEAIIATLLAWKLTGELRYAAMHAQVHDWSFAHFPDRDHGEWYGYLHRDGTVSQRSKGNMFKGPFHLPRMLAYCWKECAD